MRKRNRVIAAACLALPLVFGTRATSCAERAVPVAESLELTTQINTPLEGILTEHGEEGAELSFHLTTKPIRGELALRNDGCFVYTPRENKTGRDYFGYRVTDQKGGTSEEATVLIRITKEKER